MKKEFSINGLSKFIDVSGLDAKDMVERKQYISELSISENDERTCVAKINTMDIDADGEIVMPSGCDLSRYKSNPIVIWSHNYTMPAIGKAVEIAIKDDCIEAKMKFADTEDADDIWKLIKGGFLKGNSVGFITKKAVLRGTKAFDEYITEKAIKVSRECKRIVTEWTLIENSICNLGSNPEALMQAVSVKSLDISEKFQKELGLNGLPKTDLVDLAKLVAKELKALEVIEKPVVEMPVVVPIVPPLMEVVVPIVPVEAVKPVEKHEGSTLVVSDSVVPVPVVVPVVPKPVEYTLVSEIVLTEAEKDAIRNELRVNKKKMLTGKII